MSEVIVVNDSNYLEFAVEMQETGLCGCLPRKSVYGSLPFAGLPSLPLIPWEEFPDRIADQERNKSSLEHVFLDSKLHVLNQGQLNYCWGFSAVQSLMLEREIMGLPYVPLSPSSVVSPLVNYRNVGGYPEDAAKAMVDDGAASIEFVPEATNNPRDFKSGWDSDREKYKVTKWTDIPGDPQTQFSYLLQNKPCPNGRSFMGHSMLSLRLLDRHSTLPANSPARYGVKDLNSWGTLKTWLIFEGRQAIADQFYSVDQALFS